MPAVVASGGTGLTLGVTTGGSVTGSTESSIKVHTGITMVGTTILVPLDVTAPVTSTTASSAKLLGTTGKNEGEKARLDEEDNVPY